MTRLTRAALEAQRDRTFHRLPHLRIRTGRDALRFIEEVGFCLTFRTFGYILPCLYVAICGRRHPRWPKHTHHDAAVGLAWELKDTLPAKRLVYYGKPTLVSLELLPAFVALIRDDRRSGDYLFDYRAGRLSRPALKLMDSLMERHPLETRELRRRAGLASPVQTPQFEKAMAELQRKLWVVKVEELYEPTFCYRWDLLDHWLPEQVRKGEGLAWDEAILRVITAYLKAAIASQERVMARLFDLPAAEVEAAVERLSTERRVTRGVPIRGLPGHWVLWGRGRHA